MKWYENYPHSKIFCVDLLRHRNLAVTQHAIDHAELKRPQISYYLDDIPVCRRFYASALGLDHRVVDDIGSMVLGRERKPVTQFTAVPQTQPHPPSSQAKAFWTDFFSLCQIPVEGVRLFPINQSYQQIYVFKFIPWWNVTSGAVPQADIEKDVPLGADPVIAEVSLFEQQDDPETKHDDSETKHDSDIEETYELHDFPSVSQETDCDELSELEDSATPEHLYGIKPLPSLFLNFLSVIFFW
jgi:hypothetical protein